MGRKERGGGAPPRPPEDGINIRVLTLTADDLYKFGAFLPSFIFLIRA
jgi:hypothetical protein